MSKTLITSDVFAPFVNSVANASALFREGEVLMTELKVDFLPGYQAIVPVPSFPCSCTYREDCGCFELKLSFALTLVGEAFVVGAIDERSFDLLVSALDGMEKRYLVRAAKRPVQLESIFENAFTVRVDTRSTRAGHLRCDLMVADSVYRAAAKAQLAPGLEPFERVQGYRSLVLERCTITVPAPQLANAAEEYPLFDQWGEVYSCTVAASLLEQARAMGALDVLETFGIDPIELTSEAKRDLLDARSVLQALLLEQKQDWGLDWNETVIDPLDVPEDILGWISSLDPETRGLAPETLDVGYVLSADESLAVPVLVPPCPPSLTGCTRAACRLSRVRSAIHMIEKLKEVQLLEERGQVRLGMRSFKEEHTRLLEEVASEAPACTLN